MLRAMGRGLGFVAILIVVGFGMVYYLKATKAVSPAHGVPTATVETTGVEQDLLAIANAERRYSASNGKYVALDELISSGELSMDRTTRGPYSYSVDVDGQSFIAHAHADSPPQGAPANISVGPTMMLSHD
jgi:hypothetical protein